MLHFGLVGVLADVVMLQVCVVLSPCNSECGDGVRPCYLDPVQACWRASWAGQAGRFYLHLKSSGGSTWTPRRVFNHDSGFICCGFKLATATPRLDPRDDFPLI